jgi:hypothetical protein
METEQSKLPRSPSPSLSVTSISISRSSEMSTQCGAQMHTSTKESLPRYRISLEDADKRNGEYNRESIPLMRGELFWMLLEEIAPDTNPADVESKMKSHMEQKSARSREDLDKVRYKVLLPGTNLIQDSSQKLVFLSALHDQHAVCSFEDFIAHFVLQLVDGCQNHELESPQQIITSPKQKNPHPQESQSHPHNRLEKRAVGGALAINNRIRPLSK